MRETRSNQNMLLKEIGLYWGFYYYLFLLIELNFVPKKFAKLDYWSIVYTIWLTSEFKLVIIVQLYEFFLGIRILPFAKYRIVINNVQNMLELL